MVTTRSLVVYEDDATVSGGGRMFAIDPSNAAGVPIPAFRTVNALPASGVLVGEAVLVASTNLSYVWDGTQWRPIVPAGVVTFPDDNSVFLDVTSNPGTYAFSQATGNLFVRFNDAGTMKWRQVGTRTYPTQAALLADATVPDGQTAYAIDTDMIWHRIGGVWRTGSFWVDAEATIKAATPTAGLVAVSSDTGKMFLGNGTDWIGTPVTDYADEATLKAATVPNGIIGVALSEGTVWYRSAGGWVGINTNETIIPVLPNSPQNPQEGFIFVQTSAEELRVWDADKDGLGRGNWWKFGNAPAVQVSQTGGGAYRYSNIHNNGGIGYDEEKETFFIKDTVSNSWYNVPIGPVIVYDHTEGSGHTVTTKVKQPRDGTTIKKIEVSGVIEAAADHDCWIRIDQANAPLNLPAIVTGSGGSQGYPTAGFESHIVATAYGWDTNNGFRLNFNGNGYYCKGNATHAYKVTFENYGLNMCIMTWELYMTAHNGVFHLSNGRAALDANIGAWSDITIHAASAQLNHGSISQTVYGK